MQNTNAIKLLLVRSVINIYEMSFFYSGNNQAEIGNLEIIKLLLEKKESDINIEDDQGEKTN